MSARHYNAEDQGAVMHGEFMAFVTDEGSQAIVREWATRQGFPAATVQSGGPDMFAQMLEASAPPKMAMVDIDGQSDPVGIAARLVSLCGSDCKLIILGSANDVSLYRRITASGAIDYLVKPLSAEIMNQAMAAALRGRPASTKAESKDAKLIVVIGTRGGAGASTIAVNTGWLLAHELKFNCALLDLDLQFGTTSLALDLEPGRGLRDIVNSPQRVDSLMIASSIVPESDQFSVLGAEEAVDEFVQMDGGAITALLKEMTANFDYIVVDMPRHLLAAQKRLLASANEIVLVTELSLAGIRDTLRIKTALGTLGCTATLTVVASRTGATKAGQVDATAFEKGAQIKIDLTIPEDQKTVATAANSGKALGAVAKQAPVTKALLTLAEKLGGHKEEEAKDETGFNPLKKFMGGGKKKPDAKDGAKK
ncbi:MAG TPA: AAA family ATPase [Alphaproteobacteria bacterium]|nr:AAA family ATPase [Alphaproteobacteria bacterium]